MSKSAELFELDINQGANGAGAIFTVPDHLTCRGMTVQSSDSGGMNESVSLTGSLDGTNFAGLSVAAFWDGIANDSKGGGPT